MNKITSLVFSSVLVVLFLGTGWWIWTDYNAINKRKERGEISNTWLKLPTTDIEGSEEDTEVQWVDTPLHHASSPKKASRYQIQYNYGESLIHIRLVEYVGEGIKVLEEDLDSKIKEIHGVLDGDLVLFEPADDPTFLFFEILSSGDAPPLGKFSYNLLTKEVRVLKNINKYVLGWATIPLSPNRKMMIAVRSWEEWEEDIDLIDILCLETDSTVNLPIHLAADEVLRNANMGLSATYADISWIDDQTIKYAIYKRENDLWKDNEFIGSRIYSTTTPFCF